MRSACRRCSKRSPRARSGSPVVGFSLITNVHLTGEATSHADVLAASQRGATDVARLIEGIVANIDTPLPVAVDTPAATNGAPEEEIEVVSEDRAMMFRAYPPCLALVATITMGLGPIPARAADILTTHRLSATLATDIAVAAIAACAKMTYTITAAVVDADGVTQVLIRANGAGIHTVQAAHDKAFTAVTYGRPGSAIAKTYTESPPSGVILKEPFIIPGDGGLPIKIGNEVVGALGVSGSRAKTKSAAMLRSIKSAAV